MMRVMCGSENTLETTTTKICNIGCVVVPLPIKAQTTTPHTSGKRHEVITW